MNGHAYEMSVYDFSLGGLGLRCPKGGSMGLLKGRKLKDVQLDLGSETVAVAELEIRYTRNYRSFLAGEQVHLGCMFTSLLPEEAGKIGRVLQAHHVPFAR